MSHRNLEFVLRRKTRKNRQIKSGDHVARVVPGFEQVLELLALLDLALDVARIQQVQPLVGGGTVVALRFQAGVARRTTEHFQE